MGDYGRGNSVYFPRAEPVARARTPIRDVSIFWFLIFATWSGALAGVEESAGFFFFDLGGRFIGRVVSSSSMDRNFFSCAGVSGRLKKLSAQFGGRSAGKERRGNVEDGPRPGLAGLVKTGRRPGVGH